MNYRAGDFLIRIKNAALNGKKEVSVRKTIYNLRIAETLKRAGYVKKVLEKDGQLEVVLTYENKEPALTNIKLVSKPGLRVYQTAEELRKHRGPVSFIISTSKGVYLLSEAIKENLGGEIIAEIV